MDNTDENSQTRSSGDCVAARLNAEFALVTDLSSQHLMDQKARLPHFGKGEKAVQMRAVPSGVNHAGPAKNGDVLRHIRA